MKTLFQKYGISLNDKQEKQFQTLLELYKDWNTKINLSALREDQDIIEKHFIDSLLLTQYFEIPEDRIFDLGAGGGFPTLPLALVTGKKVIAFDSVNKKLMAVQAMADALQIQVSTLHGRAEDVAKMPKYREKYPLVVARAVAPWPVLLELALPFVQVGGRFIAYQGPQIQDDLKEFKGLEMQLGGRIHQIIEARLGDAPRFFVEIIKEKPCPKQFPRGAAVVRKKPLK